MNWVGSNFGRHWGLLLLVVICGTMAFVWPPLSTPTSSPNGQWYFLTFACGIAAAVAIKWTGALSTVKKNTLAWVSVFSIIAFIVVGKMGAFGDPKNFLLNKHLVFAAMWALFVFSVYANGGLWGRMVSARWIVAVGKWSFSIYLFHWAIGIYACSYLPPLVGFTIGVLASIGVGYCGYQWLETPIMRLRKPLIAAILGRRATATTV
jgi:peptidoglycan/LPS O-acetylase OafA/YrhL